MQASQRWKHEAQEAEERVGEGSLACKQARGGRIEQEAEERVQKEAWRESKPEVEARGKSKKQRKKWEKKAERHGSKQEQARHGSKQEVEEKRRLEEQESSEEEAGKHQKM